MKNEHKHADKNRRREVVLERLTIQLEQLKKDNTAYLFNKDPNCKPESKDFKNKIKYVNKQIAMIKNNLPNKSYNT